MSGSLSGTIPAGYREVRLRFVTGKYTVSYNANAGSDTVIDMPSAQTKIRGENLTISGMVPKRYGYAFIGWGTAVADTTAKYQPNSLYTADANVTLYAIWKLDTFTITFDANGGQNAPASQTKLRGTDLKLTEAIPVNTDRVFTGWNTAKDGSGTAYAPGGKYTNDANVTLFAQWRELYKLTLPKGLKAIEEEAFMGVPAEIIVVPEGCVEIGKWAFKDCKALHKIYISASTKYIDTDAFAGCANLTIYAPKDSNAIRMAVNQNIPYVVTGE